MHLPRYSGGRSPSCHASGGELSSGGKFPKSAGAPAPDPIQACGGATLVSLQNLCRTRRPRDILLPPAFPPPEFPAKPQSHRLGGATCDSAARAAMQYPGPRCCGNWFCSAGVPGKKRCHGNGVRNRAQQSVAAIRWHHANADALGLCEEISRGRHQQWAQGRTDAAVGRHFAAGLKPTAARLNGARGRSPGGLW